MEERLSSSSNVLAPTSCNTLNRRPESAQSLKKRKRDDYEQEHDTLKIIEARVSQGCASPELDAEYFADASRVSDEQIFHIGIDCESATITTTPRMD